MAKKDDDHKPTAETVVICFLTILALALIDALFINWEVPTIVYAIIAGVLFGIGNIKNLWGGNDGK